MMNMKHWTWFLTLILMKYNADFYKRFRDIIVANTVQQLHAGCPFWRLWHETANAPCRNF